MRGARERRSRKLGTMSFAKTFSAQPSLLKSHIVTVEVDLSKGLHSFAIVGLPDKAVEEARDRVSAAIKNSGFASPKAQNKKVVISLAPADIKKEGPAFDVPVALAYLLAAEEIVFDPAGKLFLGELALDGSVRPIAGVLPAVRAARSEGFTEFFVPAENAREAALIADATVYPVTNLRDIVRHLEDKEEFVILAQPKTPFAPTRSGHYTDFRDVRGQESAKRVLEIAAAGRHNVAMFGPPGTGKTLLARAFTGILPPLSFEEALEVTAIHSVAGALDDAVISEAPFRSPHHTSSHVALVGGGTNPRPGEITLAHRGVLFLKADSVLGSGLNRKTATLIAVP